MTVVSNFDPKSVAFLVYFIRVTTMVDIHLFLPTKRPIPVDGHRDR